MRVLMHIRGNAEAKPGGDLHLSRTFARLLGERGHAVSLVPGDAARPEGHDVVLTINLDSPFEPWSLLQRARAQRVPVCLYALHHPFPGFADYLRHGTSGGRRIAALLAGHDPQRYLGILAFARTLLQPGHRRRCWRAWPTRRLQHALLDGCAAVLVSSRLERERIETDFPGAGAGARARMHVVPHTFEQVPAGVPSRDPRLVVCPGRIESRKNQLTILAVAHRFPDRRFVFVGALNGAEGAYCRRFLAMIAATPNASHRTNLDLPAFRELLAGAGVAVNASWFEVVSLAELEALAQGCRLVGTRNSYLGEFAGGAMESFDPRSSTDLADAVGRALAAADADAAAGTPARGTADLLAELEPARVGQALEAGLRAAIASAT